MSQPSPCPYITLNSGYRMPLLGFGVYEIPKDNCVEVCKTALSLGYRHIDGAIVYRNEVEVGQVVRESGVPREDIFVTSKINTRYARRNAPEAIEESLERFGLGYLDLFLIHDPFMGKEKRLQTWRTLISSRDQGRFKSIGVSNYGVIHLTEIEEAGLELPAVNQIEVHPWCQQSDIVEYCREKNIVVQAYSPLAKCAYFDDTTLVNITQKLDKHPSQVLLRWSLQMGFSPIPKSSNRDRIRSNSQIFDFELSAEDMEKLAALDKGSSGAVGWNPVNAP